MSGTPGGILKASTETRVVSLIIHNSTDKLTTASGIYAHSDGILIRDSGANKLLQHGWNGEITTVAGSGNVGNVDGLSNIESFTQIVGVFTETGDNIFVTENGQTGSVKLITRLSGIADF
jgi:hypothetical protein